MNECASWAQLRHVFFVFGNRMHLTILSLIINQLSAYVPNFSGAPSQNHFVAFLGEFVGTFLFLFFAFAGTQTANTPSTQEANLKGPDLTQLLYISLVFGFSLAINVWIFFRISGGLFNPAVTLALCITGNVPIVRSIFVFVAQIIAAITAAAAVNGLIPGNNVYFAVHLTSGTSVAQGLFLEMFFTVELVFTILMLAAEKTKATFIAPVGIGLALFVAELVGVFWTGGSVNPARAFGPAVIQGDFDGYHWLYWIGPLLGSLLASAFYAIFKLLNYEEVNGNQDKSKREMERDGDGDADGERDGEERDLESGRRMGSRASRRGGSLSNGNGVRKSGGGNGGGGGNRRDRPVSQPSQRSQRSQRSQGAGRNGYGYGNGNGNGNGNTNTNRNSNVDSRDRDGRPRSQRISGSYLSGNLDGDGNWGWSLNGSGNGNENGNENENEHRKEKRRETGLGLGLGNGNGNGIEIGNGKGLDIGKGLELKEGLGSWRL